MKKLISALFLLPVVASAAPAPYSASYTCDGRVLAPGDQGQRGTIVISTSTDGKYVNGPWALSVSWDGADKPIVAPGVVCGVSLGEACEVSQGIRHSEETLEVTQACGIGAFDTRGLPHHVADVRFVISGDHGKVYCAAHDAGVYSNIELTNCRSR